MNVIVLLIAASTLVAVIFLAAFRASTRISGSASQFEDDRSPAVRILGDHKPTITKTNATTTKPNA